MSEVVMDLITSVGVDSRLNVALVLIIWVTAIGSAFLESLPFTTTMCYVLRNMIKGGKLGIPVGPLAFALSVGACIGGIGSIMGSSANLISMAVSKRYAKEMESDMSSEQSSDDAPVGKSAKVANQNTLDSIDEDPEDAGRNSVAFPGPAGNSPTNKDNGDGAKYKADGETDRGFVEDILTLEEKEKEQVDLEEVCGDISEDPSDASQDSMPLRQEIVGNDFLRYGFPLMIILIGCSTAWHQVLFGVIGEVPILKLT